MNKILFDGTATQSSNRAAFHGGGEYAKFMLRAAIAHGYTFDVVLNNQLYTDSSVETLLAEHQELTVFHVDSKQQIYRLIEERHYTVFYSALPAAYHDYAGTAKLLGVIHGLRGAELPWDKYRYMYESHWLKRLQGWGISHCNALQNHLRRKHIAYSERLLQVKDAKFIAVSNHTKGSLLAFYPKLKASDIEVYYSPFSVEMIEEVAPKHNYFLMVSGNRYEKNVYRAVRVFDRLFSEGRLEQRRVVITGCGNQPFWERLRNRQRFELLPYVSVEELRRLYAHAFCFVYPSLNEGFGYPPLQAMACGTPVVASSATSIPEVCDDAACYFSPTNNDDLASRLLRIDGDAEYRKLLVKRGQLRVAALQELQRQELEKELNMIFKQ